MSILKITLILDNIYFDSNTNLLLSIEMKIMHNIITITFQFSRFFCQKHRKNLPDFLLSYLVREFFLNIFKVPLEQFFPQYDNSLESTKYNRTKIYNMINFRNFCVKFVIEN